MPALLRPFRLRVLDGLTVLLEGITVDNGYQHNLANSVRRGRAYYGKDDPIPMLSLIEPPVPDDQAPTPVGSVNTKTKWTILAQGFIKDDPVHPTDPAYILLADVKKCLVKEASKARGEHTTYDLLGMKGKVTKLTIGPGTVRPPDEISANAYFWLAITVEMIENLESPFPEA